jgi:hypothetical protein
MTALADIRAHPIDDGLEPIPAFVSFAILGFAPDAVFIVGLLVGFISRRPIPAFRSPFGLSAGRSPALASIAFTTPWPTSISIGISACLCCGIAYSGPIPFPRMRALWRLGWPIRALEPGGLGVICSP